MLQTNDTLKTRFTNKIKKIFFTLFIVSILFFSFGIYFLNSNLGQNIVFFKDFKSHANQKISQSYEQKIVYVSNWFRDVLGMKHTTPIVINPEKSEIKTVETLDKTQSDKVNIDKNQSTKTLEDTNIQKLTIN